MTWGIKLTKTPWEAFWKERYESLASIELPAWQKASWWYEYIVEKQKKFVEKNVGSAKTQKKIIAVDVGCGPGINLGHLIKMGFHPIGIDYSKRTICSLKAIIKSEEASLVVGDAYNIPLKSGTADVVLYFGVMQTTDEPRGHIFQLAETLKPGGILLMSTLRRHTKWELPFWPIYLLSRQDYLTENSNRNTEMIRLRDHLVPRPADDPHNLLKRYSQKELRRWLADAGLVNISFQYDGLVNIFPHLSNSIMLYVRAVKR